ncbi:uncharacterized protein LOC109821826 [Asparagus officinalis]|uniref:uncharacterized protein LOC109821826 n=1 Tax=Asparagus officinalis TaxID=4686 RepID=UPI00098E1523|nr:uncharacterized protein LOC109821826 [Asparagus officinalis]
MAGLSVLLESQTPSFPKCPQIISKTNLRSPPSSSSSSHFAPTSPFLEYCYLCRQRLLEGRDIYMYRGDRAFCSEECRCKQIFLDEESVRRALPLGRRPPAPARAPAAGKSRRWRGLLSVGVGWSVSVDVAVTENALD